MMNISSKYHIKNLTKKDRNLNIPDVNYLTNELLSLNKSFLCLFSQFAIFL